MKAFFKSAIIVSCLFLIPFGKADNAWGLTEKAREIYERSSPSVYQIQIIDVNSNEKSSIGSGFRFLKNNLFATNYHVISDAIASPERYRIEFRKEDGERGDLVVKAIDVAHDVAILKGEDSDKPYLSLETSTMSKGNRIFSMGNPFDLGMTIVEGTYNGLVGDDRYQQVLLSAAFNPGMSGGPTFGSSGQVIGVNVALQGNDLSYLVPVRYLIELAEEMTQDKDVPEWQAIIQNQILKKHGHVIEKIMAAEWSLEKFGSLMIPKNASSAMIKCWGEGKAEDLKDEQLFSYGTKWCQSENDIYLSSGFRTGTMGYSFMWIKSESLNPLEFSRIYSNEFDHSYFYPTATKKEVANFDCQGNFIALADHDWKAVYCVRRYKKYPKLHDVFLALAALDGPKRGHIIRIGLAGLNEPLATRFLRKFLGEIKWAE